MLRAVRDLDPGAFAFVMATGVVSSGLRQAAPPVSAALLAVAVVGYAVLGLGFGIEYGGADAFVDDLYLVPEARGRGLGEAVMARLEEEARAMGLAALFLVVDPENLPAWRLYDRRGFEGTRWLLMAKRL